MDRLKVQEAGPKYCHFPRNEDKGYDMNYFEGILSENLILKTDKSGRKKWQWEKVTSARNEALDCRNYANAAYSTLHPNLDRIENYLKGVQAPTTNTAPAKPRRRKNRFLEEF
jgi:phage terminase large subunit GpA-like protein